MNDISAVKQYYEFPSNPVKVMKNLLWREGEGRKKAY